MTPTPMPLPTRGLAVWRALAAAAIAALALALSLPGGRVLIEQSMVWHMLVQMPLLLLAGALAVAALEQRRWTPRTARWLEAAARLNRFGLSTLMLAQCLMAYWMLPALIDRAVLLPGADAAKLASLWLAGAALRLGLRQAPPAVQLFFAGFALPMLVWLGLYMAGGETRLCNAYALESQIRAGRGLVALAVLSGLAWGAWHARAGQRTGRSWPVQRPAVRP